MHFVCIVLKEFIRNSLWFSPTRRLMVFKTKINESIFFAIFIYLGHERRQPSNYATNTFFSSTRRFTFTLKVVLSKQQPHRNAISGPTFLLLIRPISFLVLATVENEHQEVPHFSARVVNQRPKKGARGAQQKRSKKPPDGRERRRRTLSGRRRKVLEEGGEGRHN